jgi:hypothetical protein
MRNFYEVAWGANSKAIEGACTGLAKPLPPDPDDGLSERHDIEIGQAYASRDSRETRAGCELRLAHRRKRGDDRLNR